jgi:hypothetical protein
MVFSMAGAGRPRAKPAQTLYDRQADMSRLFLTSESTKGEKRTMMQSVPRSSERRRNSISWKEDRLRQLLSIQGIRQKRDTHTQSVSVDVPPVSLSSRSRFDWSDGLVPPPSRVDRETLQYQIPRREERLVMRLMTEGKRGSRTSMLLPPHRRMEGLVLSNVSTTRELAED